MSTATTSPRPSPRSARVTPTWPSRCRATPGRPLHADRPGEGRRYPGRRSRPSSTARTSPASGKPPTYSLRTEQVEDQSLKVIQYVTPGLLGWAVAMSAVVRCRGHAEGWRNQQAAPAAPARSGTRPAPWSAPGSRSPWRSRWAAGDLPGSGHRGVRAQLTGAWPAAIPLLVVGTLCFMAIGLLAGAVAKIDRGRGQRGQLHRAADVVPQSARSSRSTGRPAGSRRSRGCCRCAGSTSG